MEAEPLQEVDLMSRRTHGIEIFLMWCRETNLVSIVINDLKSEQSQAFPVPNDKAMEAFNHPFAFAPSEAA